jgi:cyclopropane-fatty-acyl-phospholipid synthase
MTTLLPAAKLSIAETLESMLKEPLPVRFTAYDGSATGPEDSPYGIHLATERGLSYILTAPGDLGFGRAYVAGDLEMTGAHPGDPYEAFRLIAGRLSFKRPSPTEAVQILRSLGLSHLRPPTPPAEEAPSRLRRTFEGLRHSLGRDAEAIHHHYDVSNTFYEYVLGPSMTYTCAVFPREDATLEEAQEHKYDLVARKLGLQSGQRLLDIGCGWGGMVMHAAREYGVHTIGVTLSREQASWAQEKIK